MWFGRAARTVGVAVAVLVALVAGCRDSGTAGSPADRRGSARVDITLGLDRTDLVIGEDTRLKVVVRNTSSDPVTVPDINSNPDWPKLVVVNARTGAREVLAPMEKAGVGGETPFIPPPPDASLSLAPGEEVVLDAMLLPRVRLTEAGSWRLEAAIEVDGKTLTSSPVELSVKPLDLRSAFAAGAHSGPTPFQNILWSQVDGDGSILVLTSLSIDAEAHPFVVESVRLERLDSLAEPVFSVSPNGSPFPGKWIFWLQGGPDQPGGAGMSLHGLYAMHGVVEQRLPGEPLAGRSQVMIGPALHDFDPDDASKPGPGEVVLWSQLDTLQLVQVRIAGPGGSWTSGPEFEVDAGRMAWGSAALLSSGERRAVVVIEGRFGTRLQIGQWKRGDSGRSRAKVLFDWEGTVTGSGATLNDHDEWLGATITRRQKPGPERFMLRLWSIGSDGRVGDPQDPIGFDLPGGDTGSARALIARGPDGRLLALIGDSRGRWFTLDRNGRCNPLPDSLAGAGEPVLALWLGEQAPAVVFSSPARGLTVRRF